MEKIMTGAKRLIGKLVLILKVENQQAQQLLCYESTYPPLLSLAAS